MLFELQRATQFQRDNYELTGSDVAIMVAIEGEFVAWLDDYGTATIVREEFEPVKELIEKAGEAVFEIFTNLPSPTS